MLRIITPNVVNQTEFQRPCRPDASGVSFAELPSRSGLWLSGLWRGASRELQPDKAHVRPEVVAIVSRISTVRISSFDYANSQEFPPAGVPQKEAASAEPTASRLTWMNQTGFNGKCPTGSCRSRVENFNNARHGHA
jgi:hypothetical protein